MWEMLLDVSHQNKVQFPLTGNASGVPGVSTFSLGFPGCPNLQSSSARYEWLEMGVSINEQVCI